MEDPNSIKAMLPEGITYTNRIIKGQDCNNKQTINQYSMIKSLGEGSFGQVKLGLENEIGRKFALKMFSKQGLKK